MKPLLRFLAAIAITASLPTPADDNPAPSAPLPGMLPTAEGPFQPSWDSLAQYKTPEWFRDAKFGIWAHWTAQCVPEQGDWYARSMYIEGNHDYDYQVAHYGHPSKVGFKDIDHMWHAENWDPDKLIDLYKRAGAKYFVALANHHDNFDCFDSKYQAWNSVNIGPKKDIVGEWAKAARKAGLRFGVTVHAGRTWDWFDVSHGADKTGPLTGVPYDGNLTLANGKGQWWDGYDPAELYGPAGTARTPEARQAYNVKFFNRTIDLVDKYKPDLLYFDDGVLPLNNQPGDFGLKIAAHYYNSSIKWHGQNEAVMNTKGLNETQRKCLVRDIERGKNETIDPNVWQTDTCIGSWHYQRSIYDHHGYKTSAMVIRMLVDIVSKNGNLLLNVPVRGDGTIDDQEQATVEGVAAWMAVNGDGIFGTRPWKIYGEGPSTVSTSASEKGRFGGAKDVSTTPYTPEDIRFTTKGSTLYAFCMDLPKGEAKIMSLGKKASEPVTVSDVQLLGDSGKLTWKQTDDALVITCPDKFPSEYVAVFKIATQ